MLEGTTEGSSGGIKRLQLLHQFSSGQRRDETAQRKRHTGTYLSIDYYGEASSHLFQCTCGLEDVTVIVASDNQVMGIMRYAGSQRTMLQAKAFDQPQANPSARVMSFDYDQ